MASPLGPPVGLHSGPLYAGFWKRAAAYVLDWIVLYILFFIGAFALGPLLGPNFADVFSSHDFAWPRPWLIFTQILVPWLYYALMESSAAQATLGKMALGIRVVDLAGRRVSFLRATGRFFGQFVSSLFFCIGYLMAAFTARKQALHDIMAGCLVVNKGYVASDVLATASRRSLSGGVIALIVLALLVPIGGIVGAIAIPAYRDYSVRARLAEAATVGNAATRAVNDYYAKHQALPDDLSSAGFSADGRYVQSVNFDRASRTVTVTVNFAPVDGQRLLYVASSPGDAPRIVWRCTSDDIENRYLPKQCRSTTTRL
ncbi:MAG: RDD family protein [Burkholderiaceae bacterium]